MTQVKLMNVSLRIFAGAMAEEGLSLCWGCYMLSYIWSCWLTFRHDKKQACLTTKLRQKEVELRTGDWLMTLFKLDSATLGPFS